MAGKKKKDGLSAGDNSIVIGGNVERSNIISGDNNIVSSQSIQVAPLFKVIYEAVEKTELPAADKQDVKAELREIETALEEPQPDETFLARRFRNIKRMAPEIVEVAFETLKNPIGGVAEVVKRVAKRMAEEQQ
ncbi:MAG: hypothetical protein C4557_01145 [Anaerolineaceae bacterium]|jgi:hypothetical protein|nr:MAG: hypothetical protein C4557_01145 [Anaerolineaceae bacterium]